MRPPETQRHTLILVRFSVMIAQNQLVPYRCFVLDYREDFRAKRRTLYG